MSAGSPAAVRAALPTLVTTLLTAAAAAAQAPGGSVVLATALGDQLGPVAATDGSRHWIAWSDLDVSRIRLARLDADTGLEIQRTFLDEDLMAGDAALELVPLGGGNVLGLFVDDLDELHVRFVGSGAGCGPFAFPTSVDSSDGEARAADLDGTSRVALVWTESGTLRLRRLDVCEGDFEDGFLDPVQTVGAGVRPDVAADPSDGSFVAAWLDTTTGSRIVAQRFADLAASPPLESGSVLELASGPVVSSASRLSLAHLGGQRFVVTWSGPGAGGSDDIYGQLLEYAAVAGLVLVGPRFAVNDETSGAQADPEVVGHDAEFLVVWQDCFGSVDCVDFSALPAGGDGDASGIRARRFVVDATPEALPVAESFVVDDLLTGDQRRPRAAMSSDGSWVGVWEDEPGAGGVDVVWRSFDAQDRATGASTLFEGNVSQEGGAPPSTARAYDLGADAEGVVTVVWEDDNAMAGDKDIFLARLSRFGDRLPLDGGGSLELRVNASTVGNQVRPQLTVHPSGRGVVVWVDEGDVNPDGTSKVVYRQFSVSGDGDVGFELESTVAGEGMLGGSLAAREAVLGVASNDAVNWDTLGRFVVVWEGKETAGSSSDVYARLFRGDGSDLSPGGQPILVPTTASDVQRHPSVGMDAAGGFFVVFWDDSSSTPDILGRRFDASGAAEEPAFSVPTRSFETVDHPRVSVAPQGEAVVVWSGEEPPAAPSEVYLQRYSSAGVAQGADAKVNVGTPGTGFIDPDVAVTAAGELVVAWSDQSASSYYRRFRADGTGFDASESEIHLESDVPRVFAAVEADDNGDVTILQSAVLSGAEGGTSTAAENLDLLLRRLTTEPPVADFTVDPPLCSGQVFQFSDTSTAGWGRDITSWRWDYDYDGIGFDTDSAAASPTPAYPNVDGTVDVLLEVRDDRSPGRLDRRRASVVLQQLPPRPSASFQVMVDSTRTADLSACTDCGGQGAPFHYDWTFGDGSQLVDSPNAAVSHLYAESGGYTATLSVRDGGGCESSTLASETFDVLPVVATVSASIVGGGSTALTGDTVEIALTGDPNREASATLEQIGGGFADTEPLAETAPGVYEGLYVVPFSSFGSFDVTVTGTLAEVGGVRPRSVIAPGALSFDLTTDVLFADGFESGDTSLWSSALPN